MTCCGGCCGSGSSSGPGPALIAAGVLALGAALVGVFGMGRNDDPKPAPAPASTPAPAAATPPSPSSPDKPAPAKKAPAMPQSPLDFKVTALDGKEADLAQYKGKVVVIVNVASKCGFTEQYAGLQELYAKNKDAGLVVLGFPANDFGAQEPGTSLEIAEFCASKFSVTFPMFEKISVKGENMHPLYKVLTSQPAPIGGEPKWNFTKFVIDRSGKVVARFDADKKYVRSKQLEPELVKKVEELLSAKPAGATPPAEPKKDPAAESPRK